MDRLELDIISEIHQRGDRYNIAPTQQGLVVARGERGYEAKPLRWGLIPAWSRDGKGGALRINARSETVASKGPFAAAFKKRRCLVPASGYYEWTGDKGAKQPFFIQRPDHHLMMFAGLWEAWRPSEAEPPVRTFTILTGAAGMVDIHDRQPVILPPDAWEDWMDEDVAVAAALIASMPPADLTYYPVSKAVNSPRNDSPDMIEPITLLG